MNTILKEIEWESVDLIYLIQNRIDHWVPVDVV
jgi:hypothetical protein